MKAKTKTNQITEMFTDAAEQVSDIAQKIGFVTMTTAAVIGAVQTSDKSRLVRFAVMPNIPVLAPDFNTGANDNNSNTLRREREETAPHFISFSQTQRTPSRSGKY